MCPSIGNDIMAIEIIVNALFSLVLLDIGYNICGIWLEFYSGEYFTLSMYFLLLLVDIFLVSLYAKKYIYLFINRRK